VAFAAVAWAVSAAHAVASESPVLFTDVTAAAGIDFVETIGDERMTNIVESTGVGCGFVDYDGDGWLDLYLVSGCWLEGVSDPGLDPQRRAELAGATDRLYRNRGDATFQDVTAAAGVARPAYGMGVVATDYDADGDQDLYVTNYGPNFLYRNNGDGTFTDVAKAAGVDDPRFSVGATFLDYDGDGLLDLYVGSYLTYDPSSTPEHVRDIVRSPLAYAGLPDKLFRNKGDGTFADVTAAAGVNVKPVGRAMGVGALDYDNDGLLDVFVSNDAMENYLLRNRGDGTFANEALLAGVAFSEAGDGTAAMAVEVGDYDGDGAFDILVPDMNVCCLYRSLGGTMFEDAAVASGMGMAMSRFHSWGGVLADFDLDGDLDAYVANGHACRLGPQQNRLFLGDGQGRFQDVSASAGPGLAGTSVSRGVARGDIDNDGDMDLLVSNLNDRPALLRNDTPREGRHWLGIALIGSGGNRDAIGAVVRVTVGGRTAVLPRLSGGSYLSQHDPRLHVGLGQHDKIERLEVVWPGGSRQELREVAGDRLVTIRQRESPGGRTDEADAP
jgi:hypothetical protein